MTSIRDHLIAYIAEKYKALPAYLWMRYPNYMVFRHSDNQKWFAILMDVPGYRLGLDCDDAVDILNVKVSNPLLLDFLVQQKGYFRGYHMNKGSWVSILLDGTVPFEEICQRLKESYMATASKTTKQKLRPPKEWIVPANPKYYDIEAAFAEAEEIEWKQGKGIRTGDTVYMYVAAPVSAILYQCQVTGTDIPYRFDEGNLHMTSLMKIRLLKSYRPDQFTFDILGKEYGIYAVRGPRGIPGSLSRALRTQSRA